MLRQCSVAETLARTAVITRWHLAAALDRFRKVNVVDHKGAWNFDSRVESPVGPKLPSRDTYIVFSEEKWRKESHVKKGVPRGRGGTISATNPLQRG